MRVYAYVLALVLILFCLYWHDTITVEWDKLYTPPKYLTPLCSMSNHDHNNKKKGKRISLIN